MTNNKRHSIVEIESCEDIIRDLIKKRGTVKRKLTLFSKYAESLNVPKITDAQKAEVEERYHSFKLLIEQFSNIQDDLDSYVSDSDLDRELLERETFENQFYAIVGKVKCILKDNPTQNCVGQSRTANYIKLPTISLPKFDGSYDQWLEFRDTYLSMIHNNENIDHVQKFHYLRSVLTDDALQVVKALEFSSDNYLVAWSLLENRYNNDNLLVTNHVKALFYAQSMNKESATQIRRLIDTVLRNIRALKTLGEPTDTWDTLIIHIITSKLDSSTDREWESHKSTLSKVEKPKLSELMNFLANRADFLESIKPQSKQSSDTHTKKQSVTKSHSHVITRKDNNHKKSSNSPRYKCSQCGSNHPVYSCEDFLNLSLQDKLKLIEEKKLCCNCLRSDHAVNECWYGPCRHCNKKHNTLIHIDSVDSRTSSAVAQITQIVAQSESSDASDSHTQIPLTTSYKSHTICKDDNMVNAHCFLNPVLLSTALVEIADKHNNYHTTRALLDNGSQHCFISESLCKKLNLPLIQSTVQVIGVGNTISQSTQSCHIQLRSKTNTYNTRFNCLVLPRITAQLPALGNNYKIKIPGNVQLADPEFYQANEINLLLGADRFWELLSDGLIRLPNGPYLQNTQLGWIISGTVHKMVSRDNQTHCNFTQTLNSDLKRFWELEEIPSTENAYTKDESACENLFTATTLRDNKGHFSVRIPLHESADELHDTYSIAKNRFLALERKLIRSAPSYRQMYKDFMSEYLGLGHMSLITEYNYPCYFLPQHGVYREHSSTTKLRVVFDASTKSTSGKSLIHIQHIGPTLQSDLFSILLRFRQFKYVACADVEKMYSQILVQPDQKNLQLILWREDPSEPLGVYQLNTVTYGTARSAPYHSYGTARSAPYHSCRTARSAPHHSYGTARSAPYHSCGAAWSAPYHSYGTARSAPYHSYGAARSAPYHSYGTARSAPYHIYGTARSAPYRSCGAAWSAPYHSYGTARSAPYHSYGAARSAPYHSIGCLKQLASERKDDVIAQVINDDFYLNDLIMEHQDQQTLIEIYKDVSAELKSGFFFLRKWVFNSSILQTESLFTSKEFTLGENCHTKTLSIGWFYSSEKLYFSTKCDHDNHTTKRSILSVIAQIDDPLGLLTPTIIIAKIILQWLMSLSYTGWDDAVPKTLLSDWLDEHHLIRVGGRLSHSELFSYDKRHPLLLCGKHTFTRLIFEHQHKALLHAGAQLLLAPIRDTWWPTRGRNLAKQVVHTCMKCRRIRAKPLNIHMGNLPSERLQPRYPFIRSGVDYAGPLFMLNPESRDAKLLKCYICLFVCFTTRAIHLELVTSLTTKAYLLALKRFISDIIDFTTDNSIEFIFISPYSPHSGGLWEAGVKSCKFHFCRIVGNAHFTYEELSTILAQIEAVLNSRPMYPMSTDPNDLLPLCPAHFLIGRPLTAPASRDITATATQRLPRYDRVEQMRQNFWHRWSTEYIPALQKRTKWQLTLTPDTLVLIKDDHLPPLKWHLGRVLQTSTGKDGISRVATIKTATGAIRRSYPKICPLLHPDDDRSSSTSPSLESRTSKAGSMLTTTTPPTSKARQTK